MPHESPLGERVRFLVGVKLPLRLVDSVMPDSLPSGNDAVFVGEAVVSIHRVLLAANTHCDMCVPLAEVQLMKMKPARQRPITNVPIIFSIVDVTVLSPHAVTHHR